MVGELPTIPSIVHSTIDSGSSNSWRSYDCWKKKKTDCWDCRGSFTAPIRGQATFMTIWGIHTANPIWFPIRSLLARTPTSVSRSTPALIIAATARASGGPMCSVCTTDRSNCDTKGSRKTRNIRSALSIRPSRYAKSKFVSMPTARRFTIGW